MYADSVQFNFAFHWDHKALASVNYACFHKIGTFRIYVDYNIRGFDLESQKDEPEPVVLTKSEVKRLFEECGVEDEKLQSFDEQYEITAGEKSSLVASNITNVKK